MYWCSFRDPLSNFIGVVICRGKSPGGAANWAITKGIVESERATIVAIPEDRAEALKPFMDRLLNENDCIKAADVATLNLKRVEKS